MWRNIVELATFDWVGRTVLILFLSLPVISLILVLQGRRPAWIPLGITAALTTVGFLHYATDWWGPVSGPVAFWTLAFSVGAGWAIVVSQLMKHR